MSDTIAALRAALAKPGDTSSDFDLNPDTVLPEGRKLRPAGVLIAVTLYGGAPRVLLTKRSSALKHHPGQIAFPGGKQDEGDGSVTAAALRETLAGHPQLRVEAPPTELPRAERVKLAIDNGDLALARRIAGPPPGSHADAPPSEPAELAVQRARLAWIDRQGSLGLHALERAQPSNDPQLGAEIALARAALHTGMGQNEEAMAAVAILDPNKTIAQGFKTNVFTMKDATVQMGFVTDEQGEQVTIRDIASQEHTFLKSEIQKPYLFTKCPELLTHSI